LTSHEPEADDAANQLGVPAHMRSVVIVKTRSGSTYVLSVSDPGVHWCRLPATDRRLPWTASGWEEDMPRIVTGERLRIGDLQTSPIVDVAVLPA
jgi:hypothetical protein